MNQKSNPKEPPLNSRTRIPFILNILAYQSIHPNQSNSVKDIKYPSFIRQKTKSKIPPLNSGNRIPFIPNILIYPNTHPLKPIPGRISNILYPQAKRTTPKNLSNSCKLPPPKIMSVSPRTFSLIPTPVRILQGISNVSVEGGAGMIAKHSVSNLRRTRCTPADAGRGGRARGGVQPRLARYKPRCS